MKKLVRFTIVCLTIIILAKATVCDSDVISTKIDLDSNEIQETPYDGPSVVSKESGKSRTNLQQNPSFRRYGQSFFGSSSPEDSRKRRTRLPSGNTITVPNIVNNVRIFVNGNETERGSNATSCENGVCDISVSSKTDDNGNIVTDVHIRIVTRPMPKIEVGDIPIIDAFRGVENQRPGLRPTFRSFERTEPTFRHILRNDIPQVPIRGFQESNNDDIHFQNRRNYGGAPPPAWYNPRNHGHGYRAFQNSRPWFPRRVIVDDKIEAPLSNTNYSNE